MLTFTSKIKEAVSSKIAQKSVIILLESWPDFRAYHVDNFLNSVLFTSLEVFISCQSQCEVDIFGFKFANSSRKDESHGHRGQAN